MTDSSGGDAAIFAQRRALTTADYRWPPTPGGTGAVLSALGLSVSSLLHVREWEGNGFSAAETASDAAPDMRTRNDPLPNALVLVFAALAFLACSPRAEIQRTPTPTSVPANGVATEPGVVDPDAPAITYTGDAGFVPKRLDIEPDTRVRFVNASGNDFWPVSNIHPTHTILPELDAKRPVPPGETRAFTFGKRGFWRFHNHLAPESGGLVVVLGEDAGPPAEPLLLASPDIAFETPRDIRAEDYVGLLSDDELMVGFLRRYGPEHAVRLLKESEKYVGVDCHQRAHDLGRAAFEEFGAAAFALSSHECHAGAFHGATEALFASRGTANLEQDVAAICAGAENLFFRHQCVHGVGHGLMAWTSYELHDALPLCDRMPTQSDKGSCYSGVFMENVVGGLTRLMGHVTRYLEDDDPHFPCDVVAERYMVPCYFYQTSHMLRVFNRDFSKVAKACTEAPPAAHRSCFQSYGRDVGGATRKDPATAILYCSYAPAGLNRADCIEGAVQDRFWEKSGADDALAMCAMVENPTEQDTCYGTIIARARHVLSTREEFDEFCARIGTRWRKC